MTENDSESAEVLNNFFKSVFVEEGNEPIESLKYKNNGEWLVSIEITELEVQAELLNLKKDKSMGPDNMNPFFLKECGVQLTVPITLIFRKSLELGTVPDEWKLADVIPIYKKGDRTSPGNYRPVSLTSVICKILERIMKNSIVMWIDRLNLFSNDQHGFSKGRSCLTNLLETFEDWRSHSNEGPGIGVDVIYLDFQKAFDSVPHKRLISKLIAYGIGGSVIKWITDFLYKRKMRVYLNGAYSKWTDVISGVPQGSVLGPLLFLIYVNDIPEDLLCKVKLFADDTKLWNKIVKIEDTEKIKRDLKTLEDWGKKMVA
jgi:hypothetical protein